MASSSKKGKKKGTVISLQSFLANGDVPVGTTQVTKKVRNLEGEESDDGINAMPLVFQLPTAPRANRMFDDDSVPHNPPYIAYLTNLPFDAKEDDIHEFFGTTPILSLRLPREEGESGRVRGFGYVEFKNRDDLISTLSLPDPSVKGRRIRIELSNESEHQSSRQRGNRRGFDGLNSGENRDSTNWRRDNNVNNSNDNIDRSASREKKFQVDEKTGNSSWRSGNRTFTNLNAGYNNIDAERTKLKSLEKGDQELERPKLNLKPRTLPLPVVSNESEVDDNIQLKSSDTASQKVFGSAKPVDTASRESEIEERMSESRRQRQLQYELVNEKKDAQSEKTNKDNTNYTTSWRTKIDSSQDGVHSGLGLGREKFETLKLDNRRLDKDDSSPTKIRGEREAKISTSVKRYTRNENSIQKYQENTAKNVLQTSNKYSGLDDEASE